jgi:hypothetical protein
MATMAVVVQQLLAQALSAEIALIGGNWKFSCCISRVAAVVNLAAMRDNMAAMKER